MCRSIDFRSRFRLGALRSTQNGTLQRDRPDPGAARGLGSPPQGLRYRPYTPKQTDNTAHESRHTAKERAIGGETHIGLDVHLCLVAHEALDTLGTAFACGPVEGGVAILPRKRETTHTHTNTSVQSRGGRIKATTHRQTQGAQMPRPALPIDPSAPSAHRLGPLRLRYNGGGAFHALRSMSPRVDPPFAIASGPPRGLPSALVDLGPRPQAPRCPDRHPHTLKLDFV